MHKNKNASQNLPHDKVLSEHERKLGDVRYVSVFNTPEQEKMFAEAARKVAGSKEKLQW